MIGKAAIGSAAKSVLQSKPFTVGAVALSTGGAGYGVYSDSHGRPYANHDISREGKLTTAIVGVTAFGTIGGLMFARKTPLPFATMAGGLFGAAIGADMASKSRPGYHEAKKAEEEAEKSGGH